MDKESYSPHELTPQLILQMIAESRKEFKEYQEEQKKEQKIRSEELDKKFSETDRLIKANARQIGGIDKTLGEATEELIYNTLDKNKSFCGIEFYDIDRNMKKHSKLLNQKGEFDIVLRNGDTLALIEVKHTLRVRNVTKLAESHVENFRKLFPEFNNYKIILGVGAMNFEDNAEGNAEEEAIKNGIGIIKVVGDKVEYYTENIKVY